MSPSKADPHAALSQELIDAFDQVNGPHAGYRPAHAKGVMLSGFFRPAAAAKSLTRAPHAVRESTPATVRFSDFAGFPGVADNDPNLASPRGMAIRFHLAEHVHTDIVGQSTDGFPVRTAEEFLEFLRALAGSGPDAPKPAPIEQFLGTHPKALEFVMAPKPIPASFARESFFSVTSYLFTDSAGKSRYGRYRILPAAGNEYLDAAAAAAKPPDFLMDEIVDLVARGPVRHRVVVQMAGNGDAVDDATAHWTETRPQVEFGTVELTGAIAQDDDNARRIIFDPIPRVEGIEPSGDPLLEPRASVYLLSGRRRRSE